MSTPRGKTAPLRRYGDLTRPSRIRHGSVGVDRDVVHSRSTVHVLAATFIASREICAFGTEDMLVPVTSVDDVLTRFVCGVLRLGSNLHPETKWWQPIWRLHINLVKSTMC